MILSLKPLFYSVLALFCASSPGFADETAPKRVLIIGDSMMRVPAHATELRLRRRDGVESSAFTSLGSGLARLDVFDWMAQIDELIETFSPDTSLAWFGANDHQPFQLDGNVLQPGEKEWTEEYARRIGKVMDKLTAAPGSRLFWLELPDMRDPSTQQQVEEVNRILRREADKRDAVTFFETRPVLSRRPGTFTMHVPGPTGMPVQVRDTDGIHLNRAGADRIADSLIRELFSTGGRR